MTLKSKKRFMALSAIALPIALTIGCANTDQTTAFSDVVNQNMDEQQAGVDERYDVFVDPRTDEQPMAVINISAAEEPSSSSDESSEAINDQHEIVETLLSFETPLETVAPVELSSNQETIENTGEYQYDTATIDAAITQQQADKVALPEQTVFLFDFNKTELLDSDQLDDQIQQHVRYLLRYPNMSLTITGHTDQHGPKAYNQLLSEKRAQHLATQLMNAGVPEYQINISGLADDVPSVITSTEAGNRRVELHYQDNQLVHNQ